MSSLIRKKEFQKISNLLEKNGFPLNYINRQIQHFLAKKQSKPKTDKKDDTKRIFMKLPYIKEMNSHIAKEINGFLKKLDFKVTFILINETFNLKRLFTFKERQNKLHHSRYYYKAILLRYHFYHKGSTTRWGGVGLFIKESLSISICKEFDLNIPNCEDMWIQLDLGNNKKCIVGVIYRHPKQK